MKKILTLFAIFLLISSINKAQDTIIKINGDTVLAKILEINSTEIKYKKFNFQDGPTYVENKSEIKQITYSNGLKEVFSVKEQKISVPETIANNDYYNPNAGPVNPQSKIEPYGSRYKYQGRKIGEREMQRILMSTKDKQIIGLVQSAKDANKMQYIGFAAIPLGIGSLVALANSFNTYSSGSYNGTNNSGLVSISVILAAAAIACPVISIVSKSKRKKCNREAVKLYNEKY
ncbi:MAG: hypothetical protein A3F72_09880 [Bacteroidetes bacterium RIFCSPLOWO2_12_FULL_35_15]|nr:MAG: hypothetical protein A3F72_09880 [Bacteroidetes bacterium RIFCSPLOWO2_12_FULL_35_15]